MASSVVQTIQDSDGKAKVNSSVLLALSFHIRLLVTLHSSSYSPAQERGHRWTRWYVERVSSPVAPTSYIAMCQNLVIAHRSILLPVGFSRDENTVGNMGITCLATETVSVRLRRAALRHL